ncbi:prolipoprotein diacylglyceryl transferase [Diaminobutyricibacter tongyongensis]|uniref:Phosphatidylglycerol--prolipoprotein diacylglyceryl transferase n=1 Tax=Leifsonia tongyongensis TaxID=1268043 RepID=A0A6L9XXV8_9MICO|nr:prolipoprotein diacylglyceryl transferase [Diaminobutyricibacter tongyongensis]NEN06272.1 prolipoprotein diacylglyceryl transferase [Diaminobutyricibacter tongyongensis]
MNSLHASIPSPPPEWASFTLGPFTIRTYALCILAGIVLATIWTSRRLTKRGAEPGVVLDVILWAVPLGIIFARAYHVFTHPADYFYPGADLWKTLFIWEGGNAIFGALIGGAVGAYIGCRISGLRFWSFADALAPAMLLAQAAGRLGNYFNHELFGLPTNLPWGLEIESSNPAFPAGLPDGTLFQPLFLYEIIWNVIGIFLLLWIERRFRLRWGKLFAVYLIWYGLGRSYLESIRIDPSEYSFLGIPFNVWAAFAAVVLGVVIFIVQTRRHPGLEPSVYRPGREWHKPDAEVDSDDTDSDDEDQGDEAVDTEQPGAAKATSTIGTAS